MKFIETCFREFAVKFLSESRSGVEKDFCHNAAPPCKPRECGQDFFQPCGIHVPTEKNAAETVFRQMHLVEFACHAVRKEIKYHALD